MDEGFEVTTKRLVYSVEGAIAAACISRTKIYQMLDAGLIEGVRVGKRRLILAESLEGFIASYRTGKGLHLRKRAT
jgi:excisionase family DNA binding protein